MYVDSDIGLFNNGVIFVENKKIGKSNLIPNSERTPEELREITRKGGIASGESRRRKRSIKDTLDILLSQPFNFKNKDCKTIKKQLEAMGIDTNDIDNQMAMSYAMFMVAMSGGKGAVAAFNSIRDTLGERPIEETNQNINAQVSKKDKNAINDVVSQMKSLSEDDI